MGKNAKKIIILFILIIFLSSLTCDINLAFADDNGGQAIASVNINKDLNVNINNELLVLVNKNKNLKENYIPSGLRAVKARCNSRILPEQKLMQGDAAKALEEMFNAADKSKIKLYCVSGYRSYNTQKNVYKYKTKTLGAKMVSRYVAYPGSSEHQTGLAMDVTNKKGLNKSLTEAFARTKEGKWLMNNAYKYGFVIRYPSGKEKITGYSYEPWHVRYVGKEAAKKMAGDRIVLEEYLEKLNKLKDAAIK